MRQAIVAFVLCAVQCFTFPLRSTAQIITTVAGSTWVFHGDGGPATNAPLGQLPGVAVDASGNVFAADAGNNIVVKISPGGVLTVVAGNGTAGFSGDGGPATSASLAYPASVALDGAGNLYVADLYNQCIRKVTSAGIITTVAGNGTQGFAGDGGPATSASLHSPYGVAVDGSGSLYIADSLNNRIRKVTPAGIISTVAGNEYAAFAGDGGSATMASLNYPQGVAVDASGNLYIADTDNQHIRKVTPAGAINTVAGGGTSGFSGDGGPATSAFLNTPSGVAVDAAGNLYIADYYDNRVRMITPAGTINTVAGKQSCCFSGDGGPATSASLYMPFGVAVDSAGNLYVADCLNQRIRMVTPAGTISTLAGNGLFKFSGDGGPATSASLWRTWGVAVDTSANLYVADTNNNRIRKVTPGGTISTVAGNGTVVFSGDGGPATNASLLYPSGVALDAAGNLYIADEGHERIRKVTPAGIISTVAGDGNYVSSGDGGPATNASLARPVGVALDRAGNLYIAENYRVRKVTPSGTISTVAGTGTCCSFGVGVRMELNHPSGVTLDGAGNLYIAESGNGRIRKVTPAGTISTVAGGGTGGDGGPATSAALSNPTGVALDAAGNLYIADYYGNRIRVVTPSGTMNTVAGNGVFGFSGDGGPATGASLYNPSSVTVDAAGNLYIADTHNDRIRMVHLPPPTYLVGDVYPAFGDFTGDGTTYDVGEFGDGALNSMDLIEALRAVADIPGFRPPACSDQYDAIDAYPADDGGTRGGDGRLDNFDLIVTLRRITNVDTMRPSRTSRGPGPCTAPATALEAAQRSGASELALVLASPEVMHRGQQRVALYLRAASSISLAGFSIGLGTSAGRKLSFEATRSATLIDQASPEALALAWLDSFSVGVNTPLLLGYVRGDRSSLANLRIRGIVATASDGRDVAVQWPTEGSGAQPR